MFADITQDSEIIWQRFCEYIARCFARIFDVLKNLSVFCEEIGNVCDKFKSVSQCFYQVSPSCRPAGQLLYGDSVAQWIVPQLSIRINYNGTWSI